MVRVVEGGSLQKSLRNHIVGSNPTLPSMNIEETNLYIIYSLEENGKTVTATIAKKILNEYFENAIDKGYFPIVDPLSNIENLLKQELKNIKQ